mmetsp:Transcript_119844/g.298994  ORF Transcript_119844/g.298994 Transcript_119844/m.298994 type:complete len:246 (+) Transcript_119844:868-1605(+)
MAAVCAILAAAAAADGDVTTSEVFHVEDLPLRCRSASAPQAVLAVVSTKPMLLHLLQCDLASETCHHEPSREGWAPLVTRHRAVCVAERHRAESATRCTERHCPPAQGVQGFACHGHPSVVYALQLDLVSIMEPCIETRELETAAHRAIGKGRVTDEYAALVDRQSTRWEGDLPRAGTKATAGAGQWQGGKCDDGEAEERREWWGRYRPPRRCHRQLPWKPPPHHRHFHVPLKPSKRLPSPSARV